MAATTVTTRAIKGSALTHNEMDTNFNNLNNAGINVGAEVLWPGDTAPTNWMEEAGQSLLVASYPALFTVLGYKYGGSGANFNLPDPRGRTIRVWDHGKGVDPNAASRTDRGDGTVGDAIGTNQGSDYLAHKHLIPMTSGFGNDKYGLGPDSGTGTFNVATEGGSGSDYTSQLPATGGLETRMINTNRMLIIKVL